VAGNDAKKAKGDSIGSMADGTQEWNGHIIHPIKR